jgi:phosphohistidine phosphatase
MLRLILLRHAKSGYPDGVKDHDRPLAARGCEAAPRMGAYLAVEHLIPDLVVISTARRTQETFALVAKAYSEVLNHRSDKRIYEAPPERLLEVIRETPDTVRTLMLVGHNPGSQELTAMLTGYGDRFAFARMTQAYPTCGTVVLDFDVAHWADIAPKGGRLERFVTPASIGDGPDE